MKTQRTGRLWLPLTLAAAGVVMMAAGALRVLTGQEQALTYPGHPVWQGFGDD